MKEVLRREPGLGLDLHQSGCRKHAEEARAGEVITIEPGGLQKSRDSEDERRPAGEGRAWWEMPAPRPGAQ